METPTFFKGIAALDIEGSLNIVIYKVGDRLTVSVLLQNDNCGDAAKKSVPPLVLTGTAEELDSGFFAQVAAPIKETSGLLVNMEAYLKGREAAKAQSAAEKDKADKGRKEADGKDKKYTEALQKVEELEKEGKFREAWSKVPDPAKYPEQAEFLRSRRKGLSDKFSGPSLFDMGAATEEAETQQTDDYNEEYDEDEDNQNEESC
jgi:PRTRC genetic system protein E